jgi:hypothetical protein
MLWWAPLEGAVSLQVRPPSSVAKIAADGSSVLS